MKDGGVISAMHDFLGPGGYRRRKGLWNRGTLGYIDVIDVQVSKAGDALTVNAGVLDPAVYKRYSGAELPAFVDEPACTVRTRIGSLIGGTDVWWPVADVRTPSAVVEAVADAVPPFFERMHSRTAMADFLENPRGSYPPPIIYLAILKSDEGDRDGAAALLHALSERTSEPWKVRIAEIQSRLDLS